MNGMEVGVLWTKRCHRPSRGMVVAPASAPVKKKVAWLNGVGIFSVRRLGDICGPSSSSPLRVIFDFSEHSGTNDSDVLWCK